MLSVILFKLKRIDMAHSSVVVFGLKENKKNAEDVISLLSSINCGITFNKVNHLDKPRAVKPGVKEYNYYVRPSLVELQQQL